MLGVTFIPSSNGNYLDVMRGHGSEKVSSAQQNVRKATELFQTMAGNDIADTFLPVQMHKTEKAGQTDTCVAFDTQGSLIRHRAVQ